MRELANTTVAVTVDEAEAQARPVEPAFARPLLRRDLAGRGVALRRDRVLLTLG